MASLLPCRGTAQNEKLLCPSLLPTGSGADLKAACCLRRDVASAVKVGPETPMGTSTISAWLTRRKCRPAGGLQQGQGALTRALAHHLSQLCCYRSLEYPRAEASHGPWPAHSALLVFCWAFWRQLPVHWQLCVPHSCAGAGQACHQGLVCFPAQPRQLLGNLAIPNELPMVSTHLCGSLPPTSLWGCVLAASGGICLLRATWCSTSFTRAPAAHAAGEAWDQGAQV